MSTIVTQREIAAEDATREPPRWLLITLGAVYLVALSVLIFAPGGTIIDRLRALDAGICAQLPTHSFYPGGQRLPLCARNTGIYLGFMLCIAVQFARGRGRAVGLPRGWVAVVLLGGIVLMGIDGFNSLFLDLHLPHLYQPNNFLRLATGLLTGTAMASFLLPVANGVLWREGDERTLYPSLRKLVWMLPVLLLAFLAVASTTAWLLYPIALISTAGVVLALSLINLTFMLAITGKVERFGRAIQAAPIFTLAATLAVGELIGLFFLNHAVLQTIGA
jgi:uncharacterized membrane protein